MSGKYFEAGRSLVVQSDLRKLENASCYRPTSEKNESKERSSWLASYGLKSRQTMSDAQSPSTARCSAGKSRDFLDRWTTGTLIQAAARTLLTAGCLNARNLNTQESRKTSVSPLRTNPRRT